MPLHVLVGWCWRTHFSVSCSVPRLCCVHSKCLSRFRSRPTFTCRKDPNCWCCTKTRLPRARHPAGNTAKASYFVARLLSVSRCSLAHAIATVLSLSLSLSLARARAVLRPESSPNRLWIAHSHLFILAATKRRCKYEELRASYNLVRPPGSLLAPHFDEFQGISDICDHPYCRYGSSGKGPSLERIARQRQSVC